MDFHEFTTSRLILSSIKAEDSMALFELFSDQSVVKFYDLEAFTRESQAIDLIALFAERFDSGTGIRWGIRLRESNQLIGTCGFNSWLRPMKSAFIGYDLKSQFWGQGIITEALQQIIKAAFNGALPCGEINRIQADTVPGNKASEAVLKKLGFKEEGLRRQSGYWKGQFHDLKCFGLLHCEFDGT